MNCEKDDFFQLTGLKLGADESSLHKKELEGDGERVERQERFDRSDRTDTWTTVSLASSVHTAHSTPTSYKKGKIQQTPLHGSSFYIK